MSFPWILTTPASRGIGFELTRRLLRTTDLPVIATARKDVQNTKERILDGLDVDRARLEVLELDVTSIPFLPLEKVMLKLMPVRVLPRSKEEDTIAAAASHCRNRFKTASLRLAFCIPGILHPEKSPSAISLEDALSTFQINTIGPLLLLKHFSPLLPQRKTTLSPSRNLPPFAVFALMSARVGSISDNNAGGWYSYRASKAAVNQLAKTLDVHLRHNVKENAICVSLHPGTVKTGLSQEYWARTPEEKLFSPEFAAEKLCDVVKGLTLEERGKCWDWQGKEIPP